MKPPRRLGSTRPPRGMPPLHRRRPWCWLRTSAFLANIARCAVLGLTIFVQAVGGELGRVAGNYALYLSQRVLGRFKFRESLRPALNGLLERRVVIHLDSSCGFGPDVWERAFRALSSYLRSSASSRSYWRWSSAHLLATPTHSSRSKSPNWKPWRRALC
jgi:hypothetical protein